MDARKIKSVFVERFRKLLDKSNLTRNTLCAKLGITVAGFSHYADKTITAMPPYELILKIAALFKTTVDYLIGMSDNPAHTTNGDYKSLSAAEIKTNLATRLTELRHIHNEKPSGLAVALHLNDRPSVFTEIPRAR